MMRKTVSKEASMKTLIYSSEIANKKEAFALLSNVLKYRSVLEEIIAKAGLMKAEKSLTEYQALLITHQLLFFKGRRPWGRFKKVVSRQKTRLRSELARLKIKKKVSRNEDLVPEEYRKDLILPRYVRINLAKIALDEAVAKFLGEGYIETAPETDPSILPATGTFRRDIHLSDLLIFPSNSDFHDHQLYLDGNKTTHLASLMKGTGTIHALDADPRRLNILRSNAKRQGHRCIQPCLVDFLKTDPTTYADVGFILLDPSCSGSGIISRKNGLVDTEEIGQERLESLAKFQLDALSHAMQFPGAKKIVYSTCSVHREENESVVEKALERNPEWGLGSSVLPSWSRRGKLGDGGGMVSCCPREDLTIGFFAALLIRK
ncbi:MAG: hypothetical protein SGCHY_005087 [Lobulomycetales sp.]